HVPTNTYILNTYALHNYQWITPIVPLVVHDQNKITVISTHEVVHRQAAKLVWSKKAVEGVSPAPNNNNTTTQGPPAFDQLKKTQGKGKGKAATVEPAAPTQAGPSSSQH
ncbi:hypothetical protein PAXRUDRAFT_177086, partial [Paxillus rubicundulus Ve08.2h10]